MGLAGSGGHRHQAVFLASAFLQALVCEVSCRFSCFFVFVFVFDRQLYFPADLMISSLDYLFI